MLPSPKASTCYICSRESPLIPQMLSELAFNREHPVVTTQVDNQRVVVSPITTSSAAFHDVKNASQAGGPSILSSWSGLFCLNFEDSDMFYDAEEIHLEYDQDGRHILTPREQELLRQLRGGGYNENYVPTPNNMGSRSSTRPITSQDFKESPSSGGHLPSNMDSHHQQHLASSRHYPPLDETTSQNSVASKREMDQKHVGSTASWDARSSSNTNQPVRQNAHAPQQAFGGILPPVAPQQLPLRFLRAGKGDPVEGQRRYEATLQWRKDNAIDTILLEAHPNFELVKQHYPHYYHLRGYNGEPVFFEQPPKTNLAALKAGGIDLKGLVRHYSMVTEFQWQFIEPHDMARSITVLDLEGIRMRDFVGECVEYVKMCSQFTGQHYPERAGHVIVVNVPRWFSMIWNVVKPMVDEVTLKKISIVRGQQEVFEALAAKIPIENIPPEYGGRSMPLGHSPEEQAMRDLMAHNNALARGDYSCGGRHGHCRFCSWGPVRSY